MLWHQLLERFLVLPTFSTVPWTCFPHSLSLSSLIFIFFLLIFFLHSHFLSVRPVSFIVIARNEDLDNVDNSDREFDIRQSYVIKCSETKAVFNMKDLKNVDYLGKRYCERSLVQPKYNNVTLIVDNVRIKLVMFIYHKSISPIFFYSLRQ